jgi:hypothetical protein
MVLTSGEMMPHVSSDVMKPWRPNTIRERSERPFQVSGGGRNFNELLLAVDTA